MTQEVENRVNGEGKAEARTLPVRKKKAVKRAKKRAKKERASKKAGLKYPFDSLSKGQSFTIPHADAKAGKVTVRKNVRRLAYEYGKLHGVKFEVEKKGSRVLCTRIK